MYEKFDQIRASIQPKTKFAFKKSINKKDIAVPQTDATYPGPRQGISTDEAPKIMPSQAETLSSELVNTGSIENGSVGRSAELHQSDVLGTLANTVGIDNKSTSTDIKKSSSVHKTSSGSIDTTSISCQKDAQLTLPPSASRTKASGSLIDLQNCLVDMASSTVTDHHFATLVIKNVQQSLLICGRVDGAAHITSAEHCVIVVAARQFRMHDCRDCIVYLHSNGQPIIENCQRVRFAPIPLMFVSQSPWDLRFEG